MNRTLLRLLPIPALAAATAAAVLVWQPWSDDEAAAGTIEYRLCDTVIEAPPVGDPPGKDLVVVSRRLERGLEGEVQQPPLLQVRLISPSPGPGGVVPEDSAVSIDPTTGAVTRERYGAPAHEVRLNPVLNTMRVEPFDPKTAPWPYTEGSQLSAAPKPWGGFTFREPDPASGIIVSLETGDYPDATPVETLYVQNCRSSMYIVNSFGRDLEGWPPEDDIHPEDKAAFETFRQQVKVAALDTSAPPATLDPSGERGTP